MSLVKTKIKIFKLMGTVLIAFSAVIPLSIKQNETVTIKAMTKSINNYINKVSQDKFKKTSANKYDYLAVLEIPKINLKQGLVEKDSKYNDIKNNIEILETSQMPNITNSNLVLAAHSGNSNVSFFKNLENITIKDKIHLYYEGIKYIYEISKIYAVDKTGWVNILRDNDKTAITLITCKNDDSSKQMVYIGYLADKFNY